MQETNLICKICGNTKENKIYVVKEMMFGFRDEFEYFECSSCGCLQIKDIPYNMSKYYPENYYSFTPVIIPEENWDENFIKRYFREKRNSYVLTQKGILGRLISIIKPPPQFLIWLRKCNATFESQILDVGCGTGHLLLSLRGYGFRNLIGIDPYIEGDMVYANSVKIFKKEISAMEGKYDVIMFHHSFEHMPRPLEIFKNVSQLLNENGYALIRIPTTSSYAWKHYRVNFVEIDAPRHLFLHSLKSIEILASKVNLKIKEVIFDSTEFQFWGSEQYIKDIPLQDERSYGINPKKSIFTDKEIKLFKLKAVELNQKKLGSRVCIYLAKH